MAKVSRIGVLTSGGDSPGMNAAIRAVIRTAIYHQLEVFGIYRGYTGMIEDEIIKLSNRDGSNIISKGGTFLKTSRCLDFHKSEIRQKAYSNLEKRGIDGLVVIGGNGSFKGAEKFGQEFNIPCIGIPGTIDGDIVGTEYTIGFDTAVNTAIDAIDKIRDTAEALDRIFIIEVMGRDAGYIALHSGLSTGAQEVFIPERNLEINDLIETINKKDKRKKAFSVVIVAEGNKKHNASEIGKLVKEKLPTYDVRVAILGHIQRGGSPSAMDRVYASRMGYEAVRALMDGKTNSLVGVKDSKIILAPFSSAEKEPAKDVDDWIKTLHVLAAS